MIARKRVVELAIACVAGGVFFVTATASASAEDGRLTVTAAVYRGDSSTPGPTTQFVRYGRGRGWGGGYGYGYRPYYRPYVYGGYPAYGYGYPAYGYGYPGYGYGYPAYGYPGYGYGYPGYRYYYGPRVGIGVW